MTRWQRFQMAFYNQIIVGWRRARLRFWAWLRDLAVAHIRAAILRQEQELGPLAEGVVRSQRYTRLPARATRRRM
jgi:hypothetical protein